jgi:hypothetical protein
MTTGTWKRRQAPYDDLDLVRNWRLYLGDPSAYQRDLFEGSED